MRTQTFTGATSREVLQKVRQALGDDALILSNRACEGGMIEVVALAASALNVAGADEFAGKTGTAEVQAEDCPDNRGWFIGFAPSADPRIAIAAVIECTPGFGGETAGPVATAVMEALLN